jgi:RNA-directed DNA polymerase
LLEGWLKQDVMTEAERWTLAAGMPQGAVISPLLANIYPHPLDLRITGRGFKMVRYADDFVILSKTGTAALAALDYVKSWIEDNGLSPRPGKMRIEACKKRGGFEFPGRRIEVGKRTAKKSLDKIKDRIRAPAQRNCGMSLGEMAKSLNRTLKGWFNCFKESNKSIFLGLTAQSAGDCERAFSKWLRAEGFGKSKKCHEKWQNAFFAR